MKWITTRQAQAVGFKQGSIMVSSSDTLYYRVEPEKHRVLAISNYTPQHVVSFDLSKRQFQAFQNGKLSLVPPGCCSPTSRRTVGRCRVLHEGDINGLRHLRKILENA